MSTLQATNLKHASSASNNIVLDASGNTTISGNISVTGASSVGGVSVVTTTGTQTLTNKTLTSPTITGASLSSMASSVITSGTAVASTSGTSIDFTGIPSWVKRITVMFNGVSTNGTSNWQVQLGTSSGIETTGYSGAAAVINATPTVTNPTTGFVIPATLAAMIISGTVVLTNISGNIWIASGYLSRSDAGTAFGTGGTKTLAGVLDRVRITTVGGTDTFDAGSINILYE